MRSKKKVEKEGINDLKKKTKLAGASSLLLALYLDIDRTTISKWNSNTIQPSLKTLDVIGDFLEIKNTELLADVERKNTGLAKAAQLEFKRLLKEGIALYTTSSDESGETKEILNPELVKKIQKFVEDYKKKTKKKK